MKEQMPPSKKVNMKGGKKANMRNYSEDLEEMQAREGKKADNKWTSKPADISGALRKAKEGYSKKPRVKPDNRKGRGK